MGASIQCDGFQAAGIAAGIKGNQALDLGVIFIPGSATAAAVFTRNQVQAAPVALSKLRLPGGRARAAQQLGFQQPYAG